MPDTSAAPGSQSNVYCESTGPGSHSCQGYYDQDIAAPAGGSGLVVGGLDIWSTAALPAMTTSGLSTAWTNLTNTYGTGTNLVHADQHAIAMLSAGTWFVGNDGGVWSTTSAGASWQNLNATLGNIQFESVSADQASTGVWFGGSQDNGTEKLTGPGTTWTRYEEGDGGFTASNPSNPRQYFSEFTGVGVYRSDDAGGDMNNSPQDVVDTTVIPDAADFYVPYLVMPAPNNGFILLGTCRVWAGPDSNTTAPTAGAGGWWAYSNDLTTGGSGSGTCANNGDFITDVASAASNPDIAWAVTDDGQAQMTSDLTSSTGPGVLASWSDMAKPPLPSSALQPFSSVAINPINPNVVYIGVQGFSGTPGSGHVFKTSDGGNTWTDITGNLPDAPVNWILIDPMGPNNDIYVASDVGVFVATDGGAAGEQWEQVGQGLPNTSVFQLALSPATWSGSRELAAATHGRGMWEIAPLPTPDFTLAATPASQTVLTGAAATLTVTATGENGEAGPITFTCAAPATGCTVAPASAAPGTPVTVTLAAGAVAQGTNTVTISAANEVNTTHTVSATVTGTPFTLAATPASQTVLAGVGASVALAVHAASGFSGAIALACAAPASGCTVSPASLSGSGTATVTVAASALAEGSNTITVTANSGSAAQTASSTVTVQDFSLAAATSTASAPPGQTATYKLTLTSAGGFSGTVALACSGAPSEAACTVSPASVTPTSGGAAATVTVTTTAAGGIVPLDAPAGGNGPWRYVLLILLAAGLATLTATGRHRPARRFARGLLWTAVLGIALLAAGCGGGGSTTPPPPPNPGTPAGTYTLTVKGSSGSLSHSASLTLTVQ